MDGTVGKSFSFVQGNGEAIEEVGCFDVSSFVVTIVARDSVDDTQFRCVSELDFFFFFFLVRCVVYCICIL